MPNSMGSWVAIRRLLAASLVCKHAPDAVFNVAVAAAADSAAGSRFCCCEGWPPTRPGSPAAASEASEGFTDRTGA